jgi:hypothetical protein
MRSGHISLSAEPQVEGKICLVEGDEEELTAMMNAHARMSWENEWLVPGVPEAQNVDEALDAVSKFAARLRELSGK